MIENNIIQPSMELTDIHKRKILFDAISIENKMNSIFYDLRKYNKFFIDIWNRSGYIQNYFISIINLIKKLSLF